MRREDIEYGPWTTVLKTWYQSAFEGGHVWVLYRNQYRERPVRYAVERGSPAAARRDVNLRPPSRTSIPEELAAIVELDAFRIESLLAEAPAYSLPPFGRRPMGVVLDGWRRGFATEDVWLTWNGCEPDLWKPFTEWVGRLQDELHEALTKDREPRKLDQ